MSDWHWPENAAYRAGYRMHAQYPREWGNGASPAVIALVTREILRKVPDPEQAERDIRIDVSVWPNYLQLIGLSATNARIVASKLKTKMIEDSKRTGLRQFGGLSATLEQIGQAAQAAEKSRSMSAAESKAVAAARRWAEGRASDDVMTTNEAQLLSAVWDLRYQESTAKGHREQARQYGGWRQRNYASMARHAEQDARRAIDRIVGLVPLVPEVTARGR
jgi:hypothetical protein